MLPATSVLYLNSTGGLVAGASEAYENQALVVTAVKSVALHAKEKHLTSPGYVSLR